MRPHLDYCVEFWAQRFKGDKELPETVKKRTVKIIRKLEHLFYEESLGEQSLFSLEKDDSDGILSMHKVILRVDVKRMGPDSMIILSKTIRSKGHRLEHRRFHLNMRKIFSTLGST